MTIYLDHNATTPVDPLVLEAMLPWFSDNFANASSVHALGRRARSVVDAARADVAAIVGAEAREIVFTSGATESDNLALKGVLEAAPRGRRRILVGSTEHKAVLDTADWLSRRGAEVVLVPVTSDGLVDVDAYLELLDERVALVSIMLANNETGVIAPLRLIAEAAHEVGAIVHTDATQAVGKMDVDFADLGVDLASWSAHKMYGPKGTGALYVARRTRIVATMHGGGHEFGLRSGTSNVPAIVGFGAASVHGRVTHDESSRQGALIERLVSSLSSRLSGVHQIGISAPRLSNTACIRFVGADAEAVMVNAPVVAMSSGSACTARFPSPSHVLLAMHLDADAASECLRFSVGRSTSDGDIDLAIQHVVEAVERVRSFGTCQARTWDVSEERSIV